MKLSNAIEQFEAWKKQQASSVTVLGFKSQLRMFAMYLHDPEIETITLERILQYLEDAQKLGWTHNTLVQWCNYLRGFFRFLRLHGFAVLSEDLIPQPKYRYKLPRVATEEEFQKLLAAIPPRDGLQALRSQAFLRLLWDTGARVGELLRLNTGDLDLVNMRAVIQSEKADSAVKPYREVFWTPETNRHLKKWLARRSKIPTLPEHGLALFLSIAGTRPNERMTYSSVSQFLRLHCLKAGIPYLNPHSLRHHLGHEIIRNGGSASDVMNFLGHKTLSATSIYTMMTDRELQERYMKFNEPQAPALPDGRILAQ